MKSISPPHYTPFNLACKRFTPQLMELYRSLKGSNKQDADFEIVLCSMDTMELEYESYAAKMPWWCFPFGAPVVRRLATLYQTSGIPHLVILDACGRKVLHHDGVPKVQADPAGLRFPWRPARLVDLLPAQFTVDLLPAQFTHTNTSLVGPDTEHGPDANSTPLQNVVPFDDQYLLIYASASWCAPCQRLTPKVAAAYRKLRAVRRDVEVGSSFFIGVGSMLPSRLDDPDLFMCVRHLFLLPPVSLPQLGPDRRGLCTVSPYHGLSGHSLSHKYGRDCRPLADSLRPHLDDVWTAAAEWL
jgi:thiol-disulfide isomerase/thioredoxin